MSVLHDKLAAQIPALREQRKALVHHHGDSEIGTVTTRQVIGGMRDIRALVCDTSVVDPDKGLIIRGIPVTKLADQTPEAVFFLLLTGALPTADELRGLRTALDERSAVPGFVWAAIDALPANAHPMTLLSAAVLAMNEDSAFRREYEAGVDRREYWRPALDDGLRLVAVMPEIAAAIYRKCYGKGECIKPEQGLDWASNFAHMLGNNDEKFAGFLRVATIVQSDHEGGHASALAAHTVGSALSSVFYAVSAGFNALAGPLHGLASQVCVRWVLDAVDKYGGVPSEDEIREYAWDTINSGRVIPGYGHAVLRSQDPRYLSILAFGEQQASRADLFKTVVRMSRVVPGVLTEQGKAKNPWPNVDAINGALFYHFGIKELPYYTVFFAAALTFGFVAQYVLNRALLTPITRPRSVTTAWLDAQTKR